MRASMSRKGNCYDNAPMESFWGSLKNEMIHHQKYATRANAESAIKEYIEIFYNRQRPNRARDARVKAQLEMQGWRSLTVWECETKSPEVLKINCSNSSAHQAARRIDYR
ncbi:MAG: hypothetical protein K0R43_1462, partial [Pseudoduganella sp.]|nr:hypothetical protein [Pseudoduganella sp.]